MSPPQGSLSAGLLTLSLVWLSTADGQGTSGPDNNNNSLSEVLQKLDQVIANQTAAEQRVADLALLVDELSSRLDVVSPPLDALKQRPASKQCPDDWNRIGNSCYHVSTNQTSRARWDEADRISCPGLAPGSRLASVHAESRPEIENLLKASFSESGDGNFVWIGLRRVDGATAPRGTSAAGDRTSYIWSDGSARDVSSWGPDQPEYKLAGDDCVYVWAQNTTWWDSTCEFSTHFLCQLDLRI